MTLWKQEGSAGRYRIDDRYSSGRQLDVHIGNVNGSIVSLEIIGVRNDEDGDPASNIGVPVLELLAALQGAGVAREDVIGVWGGLVMVDGEVEDAKVTHFRQPIV